MPVFASAHHERNERTIIDNCSKGPFGPSKGNVNERNNNKDEFLQLQLQWKSVFLCRSHLLLPRLLGWGMARIAVVPVQCSTPLTDNRFLLPSSRPFRPATSLALHDLAVILPSESHILSCTIYAGRRFLGGIYTTDTGPSQRLPLLLQVI